MNPYELDSAAARPPTGWIGRRQTDLAAVECAPVPLPAQHACLACGRHPAAQLDAALREVTRGLVEGALVAAGGNRGQAAAALGVPRRRLERLVADVVGRERVAALGRQHGWPGVAERAAWAREGRRKVGVVGE